MHPFSRRLDDNDLIEHFLLKVLNYRPADLDSEIKKIKEGEFQISHYPKADTTLFSTKHRARTYQAEEQRWLLRKLIVKELFELKRLDDDEKISLGNGGALPNNHLKNGNQAIVITGLPASGKSGIANGLAEKLGAIILDSDYAKRKIPEFNDGAGSASLVHNESDFIVFGSTEVEGPEDFEPLFQIAAREKLNLVIPKIGHNLKGIKQLGDILKAFGYDTHLVCVSLDRKKATIRAIGRFIKTGRYVPLGLIFDGYANDPLNTYFFMKDGIDIETNPFDSFALISTDVKENDPPRTLQATSNSPILNP